MAWPSGATATLVQNNFQPVGLINGRMYGTYLLSNGFTDAGTMAAVSLTSPSPLFVWNDRGISTVQNGFASGVVARNQLPTAAPGKGAANDVWIYDIATAWFSLVVSGQTAVIWPSLKQDASRLVWGQMASLTPAPFGKWNIYAADLVAGVLSNQRLVFSSPGLGEPYGWDSAGNILFSAPPAGGTWTQNAIWSVADTVGAVPTRLTTAGYTEFAQQGADGLIYFSAANGTLGLELWRMNPDGSDQERLTYLNPAWLQGVCQIAWPDPSVATTILAGVKVGDQNNCYEIVLSS